jgi:branched-chain amino acid transport system substrate-binding protein
MYDTRTGQRLARHEFRARRPLPGAGNRYGIEALYLPVSGTHLLHLVPQLVYHNLSVTLFGSDTWDDEALRKRPEAVTLDAYFTTAFWPDLPDSRTADFTRRYQERFAAPPDAIAAASYDAARLLMRAALDSDGTREGFRQSLAGSGSFDTVVGPAQLTAQRELEREPVILRISGGTIVPAR